MRLWTIQPETVYQQILSQGRYHCDPAKSKCLTENGYDEPYQWMVEQMRCRIGPSPKGVTYPVWAWHTFRGQRKRIDMRTAEYRNYGEPHVLLEIDIPDHQVLLSDEGLWYFVLNDSYLSPATNEEGYSSDYERFKNLSPTEREKAKVDSWNLIFNVAPFRNEFTTVGEYVQACFWELNKNQIIRVWHYK